MASVLRADEYDGEVGGWVPHQGDLGGKGGRTPTLGIVIPLNKGNRSWISRDADGFARRYKKIVGRVQESYDGVARARASDRQMPVMVIYQPTDEPLPSVEEPCVEAAVKMGATLISLAPESAPSEKRALKRRQRLEGLIAAADSHAVAATSFRVRSDEHVEALKRLIREPGQQHIMAYVTDSSGGLAPLLARRLRTKVLEWRGASPVMRLPITLVAPPAPVMASSTVQGEDQPPGVYGSFAFKSAVCGVNNVVHAINHGQFPLPKSLGRYNVELGAFVNGALDLRNGSLEGLCNTQAAWNSRTHSSDMELTLTSSDAAARLGTKTALADVGAGVLGHVRFATAWN